MSQHDLKKLLPDGFEYDFTPQHGGWYVSVWRTGERNRHSMWTAGSREDARDEVFCMVRELEKGGSKFAVPPKKVEVLP